MHESAMCASSVETHYDAHQLRHHVLWTPPPSEVARCQPSYQTSASAIGTRAEAAADGNVTAGRKSECWRGEVLRGVPDAQGGGEGAGAAQG
eukprot:3547246-Prymnesium_polylepis.1